MAMDTRAAVTKTEMAAAIAGEANPITGRDNRPDREREERSTENLVIMKNLRGLPKGPRTIQAGKNTDSRAPAVGIKPALTAEWPVEPFHRPAL